MENKSNFGFITNTANINSKEAVEKSHREYIESRITACADAFEEDMKIKILDSGRLVNMSAQIQAKKNALIEKLKTYVSANIDKMVKEGLDIMYMTELENNYDKKGYRDGKIVQEIDVGVVIFQRKA